MWCTKSIGANIFIALLINSTWTWMMYCYLVICAWKPIKVKVKFKNTVDMLFTMLRCKLDQIHSVALLRALNGCDF